MPVREYMGRWNNVLLLRDTPNFFTDASLSDTELPINRVRQEKFNYCAPASAQMLLALFLQPPSQDEVWEKSRPLMTDPAQWYTDPRALAAYLETYPEVQNNSNIADLKHKTILELLKKVIFCIVHRNFAPPILVSAGRHWVVVAGAQLKFDDEKRRRARASGLFIADPGRGSSGIEFRPFNSGFFEAWLTPVSIPGEWEGSYVGILDETQENLDDLVLEGPSRPVGGGASVTSGEVTDLIIQDLVHYGSRKVSRVLGGGAPVDGPIEVRNLTDSTIFYIVPLDEEGNLVWACFSAERIELISVMRNASFSPPLSDEEVGELIQARLGFGRQVKILPGNFWAVCLELRSIYEIVRTAIVDDKTVYISNEREIYRSLTTMPSSKILAG